MSKFRSLFIKPRVFVLTSKLYENAEGRTKATIERMIFLQKHFDTTLIEMSSLKYPGSELQSIFAHYNTKFKAINPWLPLSKSALYNKNYLLILKDEVGDSVEVGTINKQTVMTLPTLSGGNIKTYVDNGKVVRLRLFHNDGSVTFFALNDDQNVTLREIYKNDSLIERHYLDFLGNITSGFKVSDRGEKQFIYRAKNDQLISSKTLVDHHVAFLNDTLRDGDVIISDVRYYDDVLERIGHTVRKVHVWHELVSGVKKNSPVTSSYEKIVDPRYSIRSTDKVIVFAEDAAVEYSKKFPHLSSSFVTIPYGTDIKSEIKDIKRQKNLIISVGKLEPVSNIAAQIRAFAVYHKKYPKSRFNIFGSGSEEENLILLIKKLRLTPFVSIHGYTNDINKEFQCASMMLFTSDTDASGSVLLESLSNGTPVASYNVRFATKIMVSDSQNGIIAKRNTPAALADAMMKLRRKAITPQKVKDSIGDTLSTKNFEKKWINLLSQKDTAKKESGILSKIFSQTVGFKHQILQLALIDLQKSYRGALLGWAWVVIKPLIMLAFYWFIIAIGLRSDTIKGESYEYLPWLIVGLCSWFFVFDMIDSGINGFRKYKFLIVKTNFPISTIPTIISLTNFIVHILLLSIVLVYLYITGHVAIEWIQLPFYTLLSFAFMWFWCLFAAPLGAMSRDFTQVIKSMLRVLIWVSGILWSIHNVSIHWLREIMLLNPIYFIVEGYRKALIYHTWFFEDWKSLSIFLFELLLFGTIAIIVFKRSHREVVDVL